MWATSAYLAGPGLLIKAVFFTLQPLASMPGRKEVCGKVWQRWQDERQALQGKQQQGGVYKECMQVCGQPMAPTASSPEQECIPTTTAPALQQTPLPPHSQPALDSSARHSPD